MQRGGLVWPKTDGQVITAAFDPLDYTCYNRSCRAVTVRNDDMERDYIRHLSEIRAVAAPDPNLAPPRGVEPLLPG